MKARPRSASLPWELETTIRHRATLLAILTVFAPLATAHAQSLSWPQTEPARTPYLQHTDLGILTAGAILTFAALSEENAARATASLEAAGPLEAPIDVGDSFGSTWTMLGITAGLGAVGWLGGGARYSDAAIDMGKTLLVTGAIVGALKVTVNRTRPNGGVHAFPSGHTAVAFAGATVLNQHFGLKVGVPAYTLAAFTGLGRMEDNKHYLSDVIAGATIGLLVGRAVPSRYRDRVSAFAGADGAGMSIRF